MTELFEKPTMYVLQNIGPVKCPFEKDQPGDPNNLALGPDEDDDEPNYFYNDSGKLSDSMLKNESADCPPESKFPRTTLNEKHLKTNGPWITKNVGVKANPHHLIPGHGSLPKSLVCTYMGDEANIPPKCTEFTSQITDGGKGIGYDVNCHKNGYWLPSNNALKGGKGKPGFWKDEDYQAEYAFMAINRADGQFHDAHTDYNNWVRDLLDKLCITLEMHIMTCEIEGSKCKEKRESLDGKFPYAPHPYLKNSLNTISGRLKEYMPATAAEQWGIPKVVTSRFSTLYHEVKQGNVKTPQTVAPGGKTAVKVTPYSIRVVKEGIRSWAQRPRDAQLDGALRKMSDYYMLECYGAATVVSAGYHYTQMLIGKRLAGEVPDPIEYKVDESGYMASLFKTGGLLMTEELIAAVRDAGVDNLDSYNAVIRDPETEESWTNYKAVNIIGVISCADMEQSGTTGSAGDLVSVPFDGLVIDDSKAGGALVFRLAESITDIVIHKKVKKHLEAAGFDDLTFHEPEEWIG